MKGGTAFQRARSKQQIQERRDDILDVASQLVAQSGVAGVSLMAIGDGVGLAKSNIYRYYESREHVLIELYLREATALVAELCVIYRGLPNFDNIFACAVVFGQACANRPLFSTLHSHLATTLEENISVERLTAVKHRFNQLITETSAALAEAAPQLGEHGAQIAVRMFLHQLAGHWPFAHPGNNVRAALAEANIERFRQDFRKVFTQSCHVILLGIKHARFTNENSTVLSAT